ncbi:MAG: hypothetical protein Q9184_005115 [Pyrenodesmia sp. 2 TL-2023]
MSTFSSSDEEGGGVVLPFELDAKFGAATRIKSCDSLSDSSSSTSETFFSALSTHSTVSNVSIQQSTHPNQAPRPPLEHDYIRRFNYPIRKPTEVDEQSASRSLCADPTSTNAALASGIPLSDGGFQCLNPPVTPSPESTSSNGSIEEVQQSASQQLDTNARSSSSFCPAPDKGPMTATAPPLNLSQLDTGACSLAFSSPPPLDNGSSRAIAQAHALHSSFSGAPIGGPKPAAAAYLWTFNQLDVDTHYVTSSPCPTPDYRSSKAAIQRSASTRLDANTYAVISSSSAALHNRPTETATASKDESIESTESGGPGGSAGSVELVESAESVQKSRIHFVYATYLGRLEKLKDVVYSQAREPLVVLVNYVGNVKLFRKMIHYEWKQSATGIHRYLQQKTQDQRMSEFVRGYRRILITTNQDFVSGSGMVRASHVVFLRLPRSTQDFQAAIARVGGTAAITVYYNPDSRFEDQLMK